MAGSGVSAESPVVQRMHAAVFELNDAETAFVDGLPGLPPDGAAVLGDRVVAARVEFDAAFDELQAVL